VVIFSDECAIYHSSRSRNAYFWSTENPNFHEELEHNPPHVTIWTGISDRHIFGPYIFEGSVNRYTYLAMLKVWLVSELECMDLMGKVWFQLDTVICSLHNISMRVPQ
jgi:hypothetical protein